MPMVRKLYPQNLEQISRRVKRAANWCCENCDRPCLLPGEDWLDFMRRCDWTVGEVMGLSRDKGKKVPDDLEALLGGSLKEAIICCFQSSTTAARGN